MILKQNLFTITENEIKAVENGTYQTPQKYMCRSIMVNNLWGHPLQLFLTKHKDVLTDLPISYTGSSLQRQRIVDDCTVAEFKKKCKISMAERTIRDCRNNALRAQKRPLTKEVKHNFSNRSKIKIANKITAWTRANKAVKGNVMYNFITLTLTSKQIGTDKDFTKMQNTFLTYLRKYFKIKNYLYVLERQEKNTNNIHSHIIVDKYLPYARLNRVWCKILSDNGYTFPSHNYVTSQTETVSVSEALKRYDNSKKYTGNVRYINPKTNRPVKPTKDYNMPNPVDVETIYNIQAVNRYVTKYVTKNTSIINTSLWNCSQSISRLWVGAIIDPRLYYSKLRYLTASVINKVLDNGQILNVCLLKFYTKIQEKIFSINHRIICT